jgi:AraC-like DNA-binding protein
MKSLSRPQLLACALAAQRLSLEQCREGLTHFIGPHHLACIRPDGLADYWLHAISGDNFNLVYLQWQGAFQIGQTQPDALYVFYFVYEGSITIQLNQTIHCSADSAAAIINPGQDWSGISSEQGKALLFCIPRSRPEHTLLTLLGYAPKQSLEFEPAIDLSQGLGVSLQGFGQFLWQVAEASVRSPLVMAELEQAFLACLVKGLPHNYADALHHKYIGALASYVQKAQGVMETNLQSEIQLKEIAAAVGCSARVLTKAFAQHCDCSPMQFLKQLRLQRAHQDLCQGQPGTTVIDVMMRYGFVQGGKFAKVYQEKFGELPSQTLKRHRKA